MSLPITSLNQANNDCQTYPETLYYGRRVFQCGGQPVFKKLLPDGIPTKLLPGPSQKLYNHSPDGFQWGYGGSGPAQLSLALLLDATSDPQIALAHYQPFKWEYVSGWGEEWSITREEILIWVRSRRLGEIVERISQN